MSRWILSIVAGVLFASILPAVAQESRLPEIPIKSTVTVLSLGAEICLSCQRTNSAISELQREYQGRAAIISLDIQEHKGLGDQCRVRAVPTQIFYDRNGKERYRHEGYLSKKRCAEQLEKLIAEH